MACTFKRAGRWYIRYLDPSGVDLRKRVNARTKREAELILAQVLQEIENNDYETLKRQREVTFFEITDDFMAYSRTRKRSSERDERTVRMLKRFFGDILCEKFYRSMVDRYIAERKTGQGRLGKQIQNSTVNRELACLKAIFRRAHMDGKIAKNPMAGFKLLEEDNVRDKVLTDEEWQRFQFASPHHFRPVSVTAWETGMRFSEIINLKWSQVDLKNEFIQLYGENTKTGKSRKVPISPFLMNTLKRLPRINEWVFNYKSRHLTDVRTAFAKACKQAGIEDFRFHDLRHCFVTRKRREGIPDRVIMAITGHVTMECFKRYDTITLDDMKQAVGAGNEKSWHKSGTNGVL